MRVIELSLDWDWVDPHTRAMPLAAPTFGPITGTLTFDQYLWTFTLRLREALDIDYFTWHGLVPPSRQLCAPAEHEKSLKVDAVSEPSGATEVREKAHEV